MKTENVPSSQEIKMFWITRLVHSLKNRFKKEKRRVLFIDGNLYNVYGGELVYYIVLSSGGVYKVGWDFSDEIHDNKKVWDLLIELSLVKGLYKSKEKAEEYCNNANSGSAKEISKQFFSDL